MAIGAAVPLSLSIRREAMGWDFWAGAFAGLALSMVFAVLVITLKGNEGGGGSGAERAGAGVVGAVWQDL